MASALNLKGQADTLNGQYGAAIDNFNTALRFFPGMPGVADQIKQAEQKLAESNSQTGPNRLQGSLANIAYTYICHSGDDPNPKILTVDSERNTIRLELTTQETH
jgi:type II secretory pathway component PulL